MTALGDMRNRNPTHWNWGWCSPIPGTRISPSDCDVEWERNGRFFRVECKNEGEVLSLGEEIKLKQFSKLRSPDGATQVVIVLYGSPEDSVPTAYLPIINGRISKKAERCSRAIFTEILNLWFNWANTRSREAFWRDAITA